VVFLIIFLGLLLAFVGFHAFLFEKLVSVLFHLTQETILVSIVSSLSCTDILKYSHIIEHVRFRDLDLGVDFEHIGGVSISENDVADLIDQARAAQDFGEELVGYGCSLPTSSLLTLLREESGNEELSHLLDFKANLTLTFTSIWVHVFH